MEMQKIENLLLSLWEGNLVRQKAQKEITRLLARKGPSRLFRELQERRRKGGDSRVPHDTFITICALFCRGKHSEESIVTGIRKFHLEQMLFVGFQLFLCNKSKHSMLKIEWSDHSFANLHEWLSRFAGEFNRMEFYELFSVARILQQLDPALFWRIVLEDPNDLILLNWFGSFFELPKIDQALQLLSHEHGRRRQALAFWWITWSIQSSYGVEEQGTKILSQLKDVPEEILVPRLFEFLLVEGKIIQPFCAYLLKPSRYKLLRQELERKNILSNWRQIVVASTLICEIPNKRRQNAFWRILFRILDEKLKANSLAFYADACKQFLTMLPKSFQELFRESLNSLQRDLHTAEIDYLIRPSLSQYDNMLNTTIEQILSCFPA